MRPRPGAPTQPEATAGDRSATLTWTIPTDYLTKWEYRAGTVVGGKVVWGEWEDIGFGSARNGDAEGLTNGTAYTFQVRAFNDAGDGEPSPASETVIPRQSIGDLAITGAETPRLPEHSEDVVATYVATFPAGHSISWSLVDQYDDDTFSIDGGLLSFRAPPDFEAPIDTGDYTDANGNTDPNGNNVYHVTVRIDDAGSSGGFSIFDVTVTVTNVDEPGRVELSSTAPKVGDRLTAELTDPDMGIEVVEWHWQALPPGTRSTHPPTGPGESTDPSLLVTSEHIGLTLSAQVTYLDGESNNANDRKSAQSAAPAPVVDVPSAPRNLEAAAGNARVDLRWDPPLTDNGSALTGYGYRYGSGGSWTPGTLGVTTSHTIDQLTNGLEYTFEVRAVNGAGEGASASDTATPARPDTRGRVEWSTTQPRVGQELTPTLIDPDTPVLAEARWRWRRLGWLRSDAGDSLSAPAPESRSGESKLGVIARTRQYRPRVSDLNQWLWVEVTYTDDYTDDSGGHRVSATTSRAVGPGPPCAPANLKAAPGDGQVTLTWEAGCDNGGTIARYQYRRPEAVKWVRVPGDGSARRQQVTGLTNGEAHTFEVRARNRQGWGPAAQATATPAAAESPPPQPPLTVTYGASSYSAQEGGEAATVTVRLSASASEALRIPIAVNPRSGDFTVAGLTDGGLSFSSGAERQTFTIAANQDDDWDDEEVTLGFGTPLPEGVSAGDPARATVTLFDDDDAPGEVTVRPATAQVGTELTATLSDADEVAEVTGWQWHRRASDQAAWTAISGATAAAYTPVSADAGQYLQATVGYTDGHGPDKSAESAAIGPVQATGPTERTVWFGKESYEASEGGAAETVTVRLSRAATEVLRIPISVDPPSGPFTLAGLGTDTTLTIASGISGTFTIRADQDADRVDETVALGFRDLPSGVVAGTPSSATVTLTDDDELLIMGASDTTFAENGTGVVAAYTATDANGHTVTWSIHADGQRPANADSTHFAMGSRNGQLTFRATPDFAAPDFEDPDDTGHDNVYLVTVQATDNGTPPASTLHDVSVRVTNVDEPGQIEFRSTRPEVGVQLLAAVTDPERERGRPFAAVGA